MFKSNDCLTKLMRIMDLKQERLPSIRIIENKLTFTFFSSIAPTISSTVSFKLLVGHCNTYAKQAQSVREWPASGPVLYLLQSGASFLSTHAFPTPEGQGLVEEVGPKHYWGRCLLMKKDRIHVFLSHIRYIITLHKSEMRHLLIQMKDYAAY